MRKSNIISRIESLEKHVCEVKKRLLVPLDQKERDEKVKAKILEHNELLRKMERYSVCPKCGSKSINIRYTSHPPCIPMFNTNYTREELNALTYETLEKQCQECGYSWHERPKDYNEAEKC